MPAYYTGNRQSGNSLATALAGVANTYANATMQRDQRAADQQVRDAQIGRSKSETELALEKAAGVRIRNDATRNLPELLGGLETTGIPGVDGAQLGGIAQSSKSGADNDFLESLRNAALKAKASEAFGTNPNQAVFDANLGGAKIDEQFSQNASGQVVDNFGGQAQQTGLSRSVIDENNSSAQLNRAKAGQVGVQKPLSPIQQAQLQKTQLEIGSLENKNQIAERQQQNAINSAIQAADNIRGRVSEAKDLVGGTTAGPVAALTANIPGFDGYDLAQKISTIQSNLGIDELLRIKSEGGTFGALSDRELSVLQNKIANLTQTQNPEVLKQELDVIDRQYERLVQSLQGQDAPNQQATLEQTVNDTRQSIEGGSQQPAPQTGMVQDGYEFLGGDPSNPASWRPVGEQTQGGF